MSSRFDAIYWAVVSLAVAGVATWRLGGDAVSSALLLAAGFAGAVGGWPSARHLAIWISSGVAAVSGALLTLILEAGMNGADEDPSTVPLLLAFSGGAVVSAVLHHRIAQAQVRRDRELDSRLAALPTAEELGEVERRLARLLERIESAEASSWTAWWRSRPPVRRAS